LQRNVIYTVDSAGTLTAMRPSEPPSEDFMQKLVAAHPELITDQDGALLLIRREHPIADREEGGGRWSLDHLFVTQSGIPVLVELKRAVDTRLRREVIGQMLDYAANATAYWQGGRIAESFAATMTEQGRNATAELASFLGSTADPEQFWERVDTNFAAGTIKMVIVADTIPRELARIVEFLNEQMRADVRAVELSWFEGPDGLTALAPRIIGETERAQTGKMVRGVSPMTRQVWISERLALFGSATVEGAEAFVAMIEATGGRAEVASTKGSVIAIYNAPPGKLYPLLLSPSGKGSVSLRLGDLANRPAFAASEARQLLLDRLATIVGPLSTRTLTGYPSFPVTKLNDATVRAGVEALLDDICKAGGAG
jgi:hypothetical protein